MRSWLLWAAVALVFVAATAPDASAQWNVARLDDAPNRVYTTAGLDPALLPTVGYARVISMFGHPVQLAGDLGIAAAELDTRDFRVQAQAFTSILRWRTVNLTGRAALIGRGTENSIYRGYNFGLGFTGTLGVYRRRWFVATELGFDKAVVTHVTHSAWYRTYFYAEAKDGWYRDTGGTVHYGLTAGVTVGKVELLARYGVQRTEQLNDLMPPMYASVGLGLAF
jgi:hypothetical protein